MNSLNSKKRKKNVVIQIWNPFYGEKTFSAGDYATIREFLRMFFSIINPCWKSNSAHVLPSFQICFAALLDILFTSQTEYWIGQFFNTYNFHLDEFPADDEGQEMVNDILVSDGSDDEENVIIIRRQITMSCITCKWSSYHYSCIDRDGSICISWALADWWEEPITRSVANSLKTLSYHLNDFTLVVLAGLQHVWVCLASRKFLIWDPNRNSVDILEPAKTRRKKTEDKLQKTWHYITTLS